MTIGLVWFRQDLRLTDNHAFIEACSNHASVIPLYIYDKQHSVSGEAQAWWLHHSLESLGKSLDKLGLRLILRKGKPQDIIEELLKNQDIETVYWNRCYEPAALKRDEIVTNLLQKNEVVLQDFNSSLLHEPWDIKNKSGGFFKVFTPYWRHCRQNLPIPAARRRSQSPKAVNLVSDKLEEWQLLPKLDWASQFSDYWTPGEEGAHQKLHDFIDDNLNGYKTNRDVPANYGTSHLSPHLHFGEISPQMIIRSLEMAKLEPKCDLVSLERFLSELGWREFCAYLLYHFPKFPKDNFKSEFDAFPWDNDKEALKRWQRGMTGYPLVDAGMRELWTTGYMHNRVRMIVASFLTKSLLIDWRIGADWFMDTLVDADLASNSANWQWVAGSGADAAPYFRIFNPVLQSQKFDPNGDYIRRWVPELAKLTGKAIHEPWKYGGAKGYPKPMIDLKESRARALDCYKQLKT